MLTSIVVWIVRTCTRFATLTLLVGLVLAIAGGYYTANHFAINTDINTLISERMDWRQRDVQFDKAFDRDSTILAVVEAPTPELTTSAASALEAKLRDDKKNFVSMQPLGSGEFFEKNGLLFLPTEEVAQVTGQFEQAAPLIEIMAGDPSIRGLTGALETGLAGVKRGEVKLDNTARPFNLIAQTVEDINNKGTATFSWRELTSEKGLTDSDKRAFIEFKPVIDYSALEPGKDATDAIRKAAADLDLAGKYQARVRLTGPIPIANEEYATVQDGAIVNGIGTVLVVLVILWMALHSAKIIFAVFVNLFIGLSITTAVGLLLVGSLNLLSIAFAVLFVGLGVDFGIQFSVRYRSERFKNDNLVEALEEGARSAAVPLSLAAMAISAGFLCFMPTDYKGISELGEIAGAGMLIAFLSSITVLPAILKLINPPGESEPVGYAFLAPVDRFLEDHRYWIVGGTHCGGARRPAAALFPALRFQSDEPAQPEGRVDRDLPRPAQGSQHRRQRHQRDDTFGRGREEDRGQALQATRSAARAVADELRARGPAGQAETDRAGRPRARPRAQSGVGRRSADRSGKCRFTEELG